MRAEAFHSLVPCGQYLRLIGRRPGPVVHHVVEAGGPIAAEEARVSVDEFLPRRPVAVRHARALASDALGAREPEPHDGLALVITELVANAVRHGRGRRMRLRLVTRDGVVRVEVENRCRHTTPRRRRPTESEPDGRGLALVAACSRSWGIERAAPGRTRVWAEVDRP